MYKESDTLELKQEFALDIKKEIIAFANTKGGTLYIGIDDDGNVIGVDAPDRICERVSSMIHDGIKPDVSMFTDIVSEKTEGKSVVKICVQRGTKRPYYLSDKGLKSSGVYIRLGNTSIPATENAIRTMIGDTDDASYEKKRSINQQLTFDAAEVEFKKQKIDFGKAQQKTLGIMDSDGLFTNLGLLLSDQCQHSIKAAVFKGQEKDEFLTRKEFGGSLFSQLTDAYSFIDLNNQLNSTFKGLTRIDSRDYSESAIREALLNAIIHRDYSFSGSTLVSVFSDRLEIVSLGGLVPGLEPEDIFEGISQTRNTGLANIFYRLKYVEVYGTGIRKIRKECETFGVTASFHITNAAFRIVIPNRHTAALAAPELDVQLSSALQYIRAHTSATRKEVQEALGIKQTKCGLILKDLENRGLIIRTGSGKATGYSAKR